MVKIKGIPVGRIKMKPVQLPSIEHSIKSLRSNVSGVYRREGQRSRMSIWCNNSI